MTLTARTVRHVRDADRISDAEVPIVLESLDPAPILGMWWNTNQCTWGISRAELTDHDGQLWMRIWAADPELAGFHDWGEVAVEQLYTEGPRSSRVCGYTATFDLGHARTQIQANQNHGLTVLAAFTVFTDGSGRLDYFSREFFHRRGEVDHD